MKRDIKLLAGNADKNSLWIVLLILLLKEAKTSNPKLNLKNTTQTRRTASYKQAPVSQKSRDFSGLSRVPQFPLHLRNAEVLSHQTSQSSRFSLHLSCNPYINQVNRGAFQTKQINVWQLAFRARKVLGTLEKQAPVCCTRQTNFCFSFCLFLMVSFCFSAGNTVIWPSVVQARLANTRSD